MPCSNDPACTCNDQQVSPAQPDLPPPYTWRAEGGYLPNPSSSDRFSPSTVTVQAPTMICVQTPPPRVIYCVPPPPPNPPHEEPAPPPAPFQETRRRQKVCFERGVEDGGRRRICVSFPLPTPSGVVPPPAPAPKPAPAPPPSAKAAASSKAASVKPPSSAPSASKPAPAPAANALAPPSLCGGTNYMFPSEHTMLHILNKAAPIWTEKYHGMSLDFKIFKVGTNFTVDDIIERVKGVTRAEAEEQCKGWGVVEVVEIGEGKWGRGSCVEYGSDKAKGRLGAMGWGVKRGGTLPPVWLVVLRIKRC